MDEIQVFDVCYYVNYGDAIIQIFGKKRDGSTEIVEVDSFRPYFYIEPDPDKADDIKKRLNDMGCTSSSVQRFRPVGYQSMPIDMLKVSFRNPRDQRDLKNDVVALDGVREIFEADVLFPNRFMIDTDMWGMKWVDQDLRPVDIKQNAPLRYLSFDIEVLPPDRGFPKAETDPVIIISLAFSPAFRGRLDLVIVADSSNCDRSDVEMCVDESGLLCRFLEIVKQYDPDVIAGYNSNDFDIPYLDKRMTIKGIRPDVGRDGRNWWIRETRKGGGAQVQGRIVVSIPGRVVVDLYRVIRKEWWLKDYKLRTVAHELVGMEKKDIDIHVIAANWHAGKVYDLISYARRDAVLVDRLR
jgi:DNA polymerase I